VEQYPALSAPIRVIAVNTGRWRAPREPTDLARRHPTGKPR
jgi:hypothetical protein